MYVSSPNSLNVSGVNGKVSDAYFYHDAGFSNAKKETVKEQVG